MTSHRWGLSSLAVWVLLVSGGVALGHDRALPFEPMHRAGASVTGAFEGWFPNDDGTFTLLAGYYNRNLREAVDIPIGPNNHIDPGPADQGQPTHFYPGRTWGVLAIKVPKDFGDKEVTWTLTTDGITTKIPLDLKVLYRVAPWVDANYDTPPYISFAENGPFVSGPPLGHSESLTATVGAPLPLTVWVADDAKEAALPGTPVSKRPGDDKKQPVSILWEQFRGPGVVKFDNDKPEIEKADLSAAPKGMGFEGKATNSATFSAPGQYVLTVQTFDSTGIGGDGFQCCWSTAKVNVTVAPSMGNPE